MAVAGKRSESRPNEGGQQRCGSYVKKPGPKLRTWRNNSSSASRAMAIAPRELVKGGCKSRWRRDPLGLAVTIIARFLQNALFVEVGEFSQALLQLCPGGRALARGPLYRLGHVVARSFAVFATVADVEVWTVLGSWPPAVTASVTACAIGLGESSEDRHLGQTFDLA